MSLPAAVRRDVEARLGPVRAATPVGGGCINPAVRLEVGDEAIFLKYNLAAPAGLFAVEADALDRLRAATDLLRVPAVRAVRDGEEDGGAPDLGWLALEWLEPAAPASGFAERLGRGLAELHRASGEAWGWGRHGFIGSLPQPNAPVPGWAEFWRERRLAPQLRLARELGRRPGRQEDWDRLFAVLPGLLRAGDEEGPSLLHGDLWGGNVLAANPATHALSGGVPALVDPASYLGHREVDLAMSELFGGFAPPFYAAYREGWPLRPGYAEARRGVYQLYYLLVHVNLFGGAYGRQTQQVLQRVLESG